MNVATMAMAFFGMEKNHAVQRQEEGTEGLILSLFDQGNSPVEIGRRLGLHHFAVYGRLVKAGKITRRRGPGRR